MARKPHKNAIMTVLAGLNPSDNATTPPHPKNVAKASNDRKLIIPSPSPVSRSASKFRNKYRLSQICLLLGTG